SWDARVPSAVPVVLALFLFSAFEMFASTMPGGAQTAAMFVGIFALMMALSAIFQGRRMIVRLGLLVQDALGELAAGPSR
ncbi:MAG TPA: hypothetical protein VHY57_10980, partial [Rhizomicrobium sp.]|nr:hypothetical protein [Rhizomicrobium sp.]